MHSSAGSATIFGTANADLAIAQISGGVRALFGRSVSELLGRPLLTLIARPDVANCLAALDAASSSQDVVALRLNVRGLAPASAITGGAAAGSPGPGSPVARQFAGGGLEGAGAPVTPVFPCDMLIVPLRPSPSCTFVLLPRTAHSPHPVDTRSEPVSMLQRLGRIVEENRATLLPGERSAVPDVPGLDTLTARQFDLVARLLEGDRVPAIASDMFLSQSTVRSHLASVFRKVGVTSQQELLDVIRAAQRQRES